MTFPFTASANTYEMRKAEIQPKIEHYAKKYNVPVELLNHIVAKESSYNRSVVGDTHLTCKSKRSPFYGKPIRARGLVQITDCYWPEVTDEMATDDDFALDFLAYWISKGKCRTFWSTCPIPKHLAKK